MKMGNVIAVLAMGAVFSASTGCEEKRPPIAFVLVDDATASIRQGHDEFRRDVHKLLTGGYLGKGEICIVHSCSRRGGPHVLYAGPARNGREVQAAFDAMAKNCPCVSKPAQRFCGSDPASALQIAQTWIQKPEFKRYRRILVMWSDLVNDPCRTTHRKFAGPLAFKWASDACEMHLYGLGPQKQSDVKQAWHSVQPVPCLHLPFEVLSPDHLGLYKKAL